MLSDGIKYVLSPQYQGHVEGYHVPTLKRGGGNVIIQGCFPTHRVGLLVHIEGVMDRYVYENIPNTYMISYTKENMPPRRVFHHDDDTTPKNTSKRIHTGFPKG